MPVGKKINELTAETSLSNSQLLPLGNGTTGALKKITLAQLKAFIEAAIALGLSDVLTVDKDADWIEFKSDQDPAGTLSIRFGAEGLTANRAQFLPDADGKIPVVEVVNKSNMVTTGEFLKVYLTNGVVKYVPIYEEGS